MKSFYKPTRLAVAMSVALLAACGGGGGDNGGSGGGSTLEPPSTNSIVGVATKGTLINAIVSAYKIESNKKGALLHQVRTDAAGQYVLSVDSKYTGPVLLELTVDKNTTMLCDVPAGCSNNGTSVAFGKAVSLGLLNPTFSLRSFVATPALIIHTAITPLTELAAAQVLQSSTITADTVRNQMNTVRLLFRQFTMPDLNTTQPVDLTSSTAFANASADAQLYTLLDAAFAQLTAGDVNQLSDRIKAYASALQTNSGRLLQYSTNDTDADMESLLTAVRLGIINDPNFKASVKAAVLTNVDAELAAVKKNGNALTGVTGTVITANTDLEKAKVFVNGLKGVLSDLVLEGDQDLRTAVNTRYQSLLGLFMANGEQEAALLDVDQALNMTSRALMFGVANANQTQQLHRSLQSILDDVVLNTSLSVMATTPELLADAQAKTITLTEPQLQLTVSGKKPHTFNMSNFTVPYVDVTQAQTSYSLPWQAAGTLDGANVKLTLASADRGQLALMYNNAVVFNNSLPSGAVLTFKQAQLQVKQDSQLRYTGDISLSLKPVGQALATDTWQLASGAVSTTAGDMTASMAMSSGAAVPSNVALVFDMAEQKFGQQTATVHITASATNADLIAAGTIMAKLDLSDRSVTFAPTSNLAATGYSLKDDLNGVEVQMTLSDQLRTGTIMVNGKSQGTLKVQNGKVFVTFSDGVTFSL